MSPNFDKRKTLLWKTKRKLKWGLFDVSLIKLKSKLKYRPGRLRAGRTLSGTKFEFRRGKGKRRKKARAPRYKQGGSFLRAFVNRGRVILRAGGKGANREPNWK